MIIKDLEELKESEPREYEKLHFQNIHSLVTVPLIENDAVMGFLEWIILPCRIWKIRRQS